VAAAAAGEEICTENFGERDQRIDLGKIRGEWIRDGGKRCANRRRSDSAGGGL
jgi:hypothetical protein